MYRVFLRLFNISVEAMWLILAVLVLRLALTRARKSVRCAMWGVVGLRLALPVSVKSALSLLPSGVTLSPYTVRFSAAPTLATGLPVIDDAVNPWFSRVFAGGPGGSVNPLHVYTELAGWVWLFGLLGMAGYFAVSAVMLRRTVSGAVQTEPSVFESERIPSPFVFGLFRPRAYLPAGMDPKRRRLVAAHEIAHITRRDYLLKPLAFILLAVYWFSPFVWLAYILFCRDMELACDERVLDELGAGCKKDYSEALLEAVTYHRPTAASPVAFGEGNLKSRVKNVLRWKKPAAWLTALAVVLCAVLAVCFLTEPTDAAEEAAVGVYVYEGESNPVFTPFGITVTLENGERRFSFYEGTASSYFGAGPWSLEDGVLTLTDVVRGSPVVYRFRLTEEGLRFIEDGSEGFMFHDVRDGELFRR